MSKSLNAHVTELATRQASKPSVAINRNLDVAHSRLTAVLRCKTRPRLLREITEQSLRALASSLGLDCWVDEPLDGCLVVSITGKIIVVDIGLSLVTNDVQYCNLSLAFDEEGAGKDREDASILLGNIHSGRLDHFAKNLALLAFLDQRSDVPEAFSLFEVYDRLRNALRRKLKDNTGEPLHVKHAYSNPTFHFHQTQYAAQIEGLEDLRRIYTASIEVEEQPIAAKLETSEVRHFSLDDLIRKPVLRWPDSWVYGSNIWITDEQLIYEQFKEGLRYVLVFTQPVIIPSTVAQQLANGFPPRIETHPFTDVRSRIRNVHSPDRDLLYRTNFDTDVAMESLSRIAFTHPKELTRIFSIAHQFIRCQELLQTLGNAQTLKEQRHPIVLVVRLELVADVVSDIDNRISVKLSIYSESITSKAKATILILPDCTEECWHETNSLFFGRAIKATGDILVSLIATSKQGVLR